MPLHFTKMHGLGNDFIVIDMQSQNIELTPLLIQALCDRHYGVGCDQLLIVNKTKNAAENHFDYQIFNADGSEAEQCGNGARCVASYLFETQKINTPNIILQTKNREIEILKKEDGIYNVNMGTPEFGQFNAQLNYFPISMGNPHAVMIVTDINNALVDDIGKQFNNNHPDFPHGVNAGFVQIHNRNNLSVRVYERGAGETLACGSGACAAVAAGILLGLLDTLVTVHLKGGDLTIEWSSQNDSLWMSGPAVKVFVGIV